MVMLSVVVGWDHRWDVVDGSSTIGRAELPVHRLYVLVVSAGLIGDEEDG